MHVADVDTQLPALVVTASGKLGRRGEDAEAREMASRLGVPYAPYRRGQPITSLFQLAPAALRLRGDGVELVDIEGSLRWSPGMGELRARRLDDGVDQPD